MKTTTAEERRSRYRLWYPRVARPTLIVDDHQFPVAELSEGGVLFIDPNQQFALNTSLKGKVQFQEPGEVDEVSGVVLRYKDQMTVLMLTAPIAFNRMIQQQRYVAAKYGR